MCSHLASKEQQLHLISMVVKYLQQLLSSSYFCQTSWQPFSPPLEETTGEKSWLNTPTFYFFPHIHSSHLRNYSLAADVMTLITESDSARGWVLSTSSSKASALESCFALPRCGSLMVIMSGATLHILYLCSHCPPSSWPSYSPYSFCSWRNVAAVVALVWPAATSLTRSEYMIQIRRWSRWMKQLR